MPATPDWSAARFSNRMARTSLSARPGSRGAPGHRPALRRACSGRGGFGRDFPRWTVTASAEDASVRRRGARFMPSLAWLPPSSGRLSSGRCCPRRRRDSDRRSSRSPRSLAGRRRRRRFEAARPTVHVINYVRVRRSEVSHLSDLRGSAPAPIGGTLREGEKPEVDPPVSKTCACSSA